MARFNITPQELPRALKSRQEGMDDALKRGINNGLQRARTIMVRASPRDQGQMAASWKADLVRVLRPGELAALYNTAPHVGVVERGARPHGVNQEGWDAIYEWARRHFGYTTPIRRKAGESATSVAKRMSSQRMKRIGGDVGDDPFLSAITWGIVGKLQKYGQEPTYFIRENLERCRDEMAKSVNREVRKLSRRKT